MATPAPTRGRTCSNSTTSSSPPAAALPLPLSPVIVIRRLGIPAAALRGGYWDHGAKAGAFALRLNYGPSAWRTYNGARCCRQR